MGNGSEPGHGNVYFRYGTGIGRMNHIAATQAPVPQGRVLLFTADCQVKAFVSGLEINLLDIDIAVTWRSSYEIQSGAPPYAFGGYLLMKYTGL
jgi:hypothetical protein